MSEDIDDQVPDEDSLDAKKEIIERFLASQEQEMELKTQELQIRAEELELEKQKDQHAFEFAQQSLSAQKEDRVDARKHQSTLQKTILGFVAGIAILIAAIIIIAIYKNQADIAKEVIKALTYGGIGSLGGYGFGRYKKAVHDNDDSD